MLLQSRGLDQLSFALKVGFSGYEFRVVSYDLVDRLFSWTKATIHEVTRNNTKQKTFPVRVKCDF